MSNSIFIPLWIVVMIISFLIGLHLPLLIVGIAIGVFLEKSFSAVIKN